MNSTVHNNTIKVDAVIIGGGIAGLFALAKLINRGYRAVLLEKGALGDGQTLKSQGIIHGGTKYALLGKTTEAQRQIAAMPGYWRACLSGDGDIDLSACTVLADKQCMWAMPNLSGRVTGFFAGKMMKSRVEALNTTDTDSTVASALPPTLQHPDCRGRFYALDEPVLDVRSLIAALVAQYGDCILSNCGAEIADNDDIDDSGVVSASRDGTRWRFSADKILITAGQGNANFAAQQLRPLRMVYARVPKAFGKLFLHVLETSDKPRLTISSYDSGERNTGSDVANNVADNADDNLNEWIWYLGGNLAEKGASLSADETQALAKRELTNIFPWLDFTGIAFDSFIVNRAEGLADGKRPDTPILVENGNQLIAWPTKLALAPMLADSLLAKMPPPRGDSDTLPRFPPVVIGDFPWAANRTVSPIANHRSK